MNRDGPVLADHLTFPSSSNARGRPVVSVNPEVAANVSFQGAPQAAAQRSARSDQFAGNDIFAALVESNTANDANNAASASQQQQNQQPPAAPNRSDNTPPPANNNSGPANNAANNNAAANQPANNDPNNNNNNNNNNSGPSSDANTN